MKLKKLLVVMIVILLVVTNLSACTSSKSDTSSKNSGGSDKDVSFEQEEEIEISIAFWDIKDFGEDPMGKIIEDKLNIKIKAVPLSWDTDAEQIKLFAATGDMPDCVSTYTVSDPSRFYGWIDQEVTRSIPEEMLDEFPHAKQVFDNSKCLQAVKDIKGEYYFIPRPESAADIHIAQQSVIYYRKDWVKNLGIKEPETMDELYSLYKAYTEEDPDQNGKDDTIGLTLAGGLASGLFAPYGVDPAYWLEEEGRFIPGYLSKKNIEPLKFYRKLYREGLLDPEYAQNGYKEALGKLAKNTAGSMIRNGDTAWLKGTIMEYYGEANEDKGDPLEIMGVLPPMKKDASSDPSWPVFISTCGTEISSSVDDNKLRRILALDDFLLSPEGKDLMRWGIEGEDYTKEGEKYTSLLGEDEMLGDKYASRSIKNFSDWDFDFLSIPPGDPLMPEEYMKLGDKVRDMYNPWARDERFDVTYLSTESKDNLTISWGESFTQIVVGPDDVEVAFDRFVQDCVNKGVEKAISDINALANK